MDRDVYTKMLADQLRAERNAAQQRAEQAERERDAARAVIDRVKDAVNELSFRGANSSNLRAAQGVMVSVNELRVALGETPDFEFDMSAEAQPAWTPQTGAEIAAAIGDKPILPPDFQLEPSQPAPTVKAEAPVMTHLVRVDELNPSELLSAIGMRLNLTNENLTDDRDDVALRQMHNVLVLMYHHILKGGAK